MHQTVEKGALTFWQVCRFSSWVEDDGSIKFLYGAAPCSDGTELDGQVFPRVQQQRQPSETCSCELRSRGREVKRAEATVFVSMFVTQRDEAPQRLEHKEARFHYGIEEEPNFEPNHFWYEFAVCSCLFELSFSLFVFTKLAQISYRLGFEGFLWNKLKLSWSVLRGQRGVMACDGSKISCSSSFTFVVYVLLGFKGGIQSTVSLLDSKLATNNPKTQLRRCLDNMVCTTKGKLDSIEITVSQKKRQVGAVQQKFKVPELCCCFRGGEKQSS